MTSAVRKIIQTMQQFEDHEQACMLDLMDEAARILREARRRALMKQRPKYTAKTGSNLLVGPWIGKPLMKRVRKYVPRVRR